MHTVDVVIVGGGISGLAAAYELSRRGAEILLLEEAQRPGGVVLTERAGGFTLEAGPDSFLASKPGALALCEDLGIASRVVSMTPPRTAYVLRGGELEPLPEPAVLGIPAGLRALWSTRLLSLAGKLRVLAERLVPRGPAARGRQDESIGGFVRRRLGHEMAAVIAEPLLAGIHAGDAEALSVRALFPMLVEAEARHRSLRRAVARRVGAAPPDGPFRSLAGGMDELVGALVAGLPAGAVRCGAPAAALDVNGACAVRLRSGQTVRARAVLLAVSARAAGAMLAPLDPEAAALCQAIPYVSSVVVVLGYAREAVRHPLAGSGFVVPRTEPHVRLLGASWASSKWPGRAPPGHVLLRAFMGGTRDPAAVDRADAALIEEAHAGLARILGIDAAPVLARVYRWRDANPQLVVGHLERMAALEARLGRLPGLYLTGSGFRGVGLPDCIADARATAVSLAARLIQ